MCIRDSAYAVAGMVCFKDGVPSKKDYRKFKIKTVDGPDDYGSCLLYTSRCV